MREGDLVIWHTEAWVFKHAEKRYANPGIILRKLHREGTQPAYEIMWADGSVSNEYEGYLVNAAA
jgi:hypothetical protein